MKTLLLTFASLSLVAACSGAETSPAPAPSPNPTSTSPTDPPVGQTGQALVFTAPCESDSCANASGAADGANRCAPDPKKSGVCAWAPPTGSSSDPNGTVSYSLCPDKLCGARPAPACPTGTTFASATCGSENDSACTWTTHCAAPRSTTPCPTPSGCGDAKPEIGVVCKDGSAGDLVCMKTGNKCAWERSCD
jgi:hypothetical protein